MAFTPEELEEMRRADAEIDRNFRLTNDDLRRSRQLDRDAALEAKDNKGRQTAAQKKAWYEANREKVSAQKKAWYEANREKVSAQKKAWYEANREKVSAQQKAYREANRADYNAYMREYMKKRRLAKAAAT